jgi:iron complex outermembrane recepter protein
MSRRSPANFQLAEIRDRPSTVTNKFKTAQLRTEWDMTPGVTIKLGGVWRQFDFAYRIAQRDTAVCTNAAGGFDTVLGTINCTPSTVFGPTAVYGFPVTTALSEVFQLPNAGAPAGTTTSWLSPNLQAATDFTKRCCQSNANRSPQDAMRPAGAQLQPMTICHSARAAERRVL